MPEPDHWVLGVDLLQVVDLNAIGELEVVRIELHQESSFFKWETLAYNLIKIAKSSPKLKNISLTAVSLGLFPGSLENMFDLIREFPRLSLVIEIKCNSLFTRKFLQEVLEATID